VTLRRRLSALAILVPLLAACSSGDRREQKEEPRPQLSGPGPHLFSEASDCSRDVTGALNAFIAAAPNPSTITFPSDACFEIAGKLELQMKQGLTVEGNGATFRAKGDGERSRWHWGLEGGSDITIRNVTVKGAHPKGGATDDAYVRDREHQHGFRLAGVRNVTLEDVTVTDVYGDFVYLREASRDVKVLNSRFERNGRQGIAIVEGEDVLIRGNSLTGAARSMFDLEPNDDRRIIKNVTIEDNDIGSFKNRLLAIDKDGFISDVRMVGNRVKGGRLEIRVGDYLKDAGQGNRQRNISIIGNISDSLSRNAVIQVSDVDGIVIRNNVQPFESLPQEAAVLAVNSCDVVVEENQFTGTAMPLEVSGTCPQR
jgi:hypothetical protein